MIYEDNNYGSPYWEFWSEKEIFSELQNASFLKIIEREYVPFQSGYFTRGYQNSIKYKVCEPRSIFWSWIFEKLKLKVEKKQGIYLIVRSSRFYEARNSDREFHHKLTWYSEPGNSIFNVPYPNYLTFEEVLDRVSPETQSSMLFHLDLFTKPTKRYGF